jgi:WS/DGAT/MGAT family acyltransferase
MQRLNGLDAGMVYAETDAWHMHAGALFVVDRPPGDPAKVLADLLRARMHLLTPLRRLLVEPPLHLGLPVWIDVPEVDVEDHIHRVGVPSPGGPREVADLAGQLFSTKLDRDRPPWEFWVLEGLEDGRVAFLLKIHHSLVDGVRAARLYEVLFDLDPDAPRARPGDPHDHDEPAPSTARMVRGSIRFALGAPARVLRLAGALGSAAAGMGRIVASAARDDVTWPFRAPRVSLNRPLTARREVAFASVPMADVRAVSATFGVTVNDVALAMCAGALRSYLQDRGELPKRSLVAQIPVGVHRDDTGTDGNFVAPVGATLHTDVADPAARLRAIHASTRNAKDVQVALGDDLVVRALEAVPPLVLTAVVDAYQALGLAELHPPIFNLIVSNVAGPPVPLYFAGGRLADSYLLGPLLMGCGLNITLASYLDRLDFGVVTCPDVVDDPHAIAAGLPEALDELVKVVS